MPVTPCIGANRAVIASSDDRTLAAEIDIPYVLSMCFEKASQGKAERPRYGYPIYMRIIRMNDLPLQPLAWIEDADSSVAQHEFIEYRVIPDHDSFGKFAVRYKDSRHRPATGFATIDEAKAWAWNHYNEKMQPYVKPMPTWIDASEQLPQVDVDTQFICAYDSAIEPYVRVTTFSVEMGDFGLDHADVLAWMPIPEFSTMQNLHNTIEAQDD